MSKLIQPNVLTDLHARFKPHPGQIVIGKQIFQYNKKLVVARCGRKWGKTKSVCYISWRWANTYPNQAIFYFAPFMNQAREIIWKDLKEFGPKGWIKRTSDNDLRIEFWNGSFIKLEGADNFQARRGINPHLVFYDEYKDFHPEFDQAMRPNLMSHRAPLVVTGTPPSNNVLPEEINYFAMEEEAKHDEDGFFYHGPSHERADPDFLKDLEKAKQTAIRRGEYDVYQREYEAIFVKSGAKTVFPMLDKDAHVRSYSELHQRISLNPSLYEYYTIADPGTRHCFCVLFIALHKYRPEILVLDEIYETNPFNTSTRVIYPILLAKEAETTNQPVERFRYYDEAATWFWVETPPDDCWMPTQKAQMRNETRDGKPYLSSIKDGLLEGYLLYSDRCVNTFNEMLTYQKDKNGNYPKKDDHAIDVQRYFFAVANICHEEIPLINQLRGVNSRESENRIFEEFDECDDYEDEDMINDLAKRFT